jgi:hypothetical protein
LSFEADRGNSALRPAFLIIPAAWIRRKSKGPPHPPPTEIALYGKFETNFFAGGQGSTADAPTTHLPNGISGLF